MQIQHRSPALTLGAATRHATCAMLATLALCTPALSQSAPQLSPDGPVTLATAGPLASAMTREVVRLADSGAPTRGTFAQHSGAPTRHRRLGKWAVIPGLFVGAFLGAGVDCWINGCGPGGPNIPSGVGVGMLVGAVTTAFAPREVAGTFLGVGGGFVAGGAIGAAIEGDCGPDHPCKTGVGVGAPVGAIAGGLLGYRMSSN